MGRLPVQLHAGCHGSCGELAAGGPKKLWSRALGEGHSAILVEDGRIYTMYRPLGLLSAVRRSPEEVVAAIDAASGKTIWEFKYPAPTDGLDFSQAPVPTRPRSSSATGFTRRARARSCSRSIRPRGSECGRTTS
jgi:hypothetical protein